MARFKSYASIRFCESPTSDLEIRTPKGRGKRGRGSNCTPVNEVISAPETRSSTQNKLRSGKGRRGGASTFAMPPSPAKQDGAAGVKRKGRGNDGNGCSGVNGTTIGVAGGESPSGKRSRSTSCRSTPTPVGGGNNSGSSNGAGSGAGGGTTATIEPPGSPVLIECPEPNCGKKYKHINGLKYHQSHAHADSRRSSSPSSTIGSCEAVKLETAAGSVSDNETEMEESVDGAVDIKTEPGEVSSAPSSESVMLITPKQENVDDTESAEQSTSKSGGPRFVEADASAAPQATSSSISAVPSTVSSHAAKASDAGDEPVYQRSGPKPAVRVPAANGDKLRPLTNTKPIMPIPSQQTVTLSSGVSANKPNGPLGLANMSPLLPAQSRPSLIAESNPVVSAELDNLRRERIKNRKRNKDGKMAGSRPPSAASSPPSAGEAGKVGSPAVVVQVSTSSVMVPTTNSVTTSALLGPIPSLSPCLPPTNVDEPSSREEVQSPAYSDISDPNDSGANDSHCDVQGVGAKTASNCAEAPKSPLTDASPPPPSLQPGYPNFPFYGAQLPFPVSPVPSLHRPMGGSPGRTKGPESSPSMPSPARKDDVPPTAKDEQRTRDGKAPGGDKMMPQVYPYGFNYHQYGAVDPNFLRLGSDPAYKQFVQDQERAASDSEKSSSQMKRGPILLSGMEKAGQGPTDLSKSVGNLGLPSGTNVTVKDVKTGGEGAVKEAKSIPMSDDKGHRQFLGASRASGGGGVGAGDEKRDLYVAVSRHGGGSVSAPKSGSSSSPKSLPPGKSEGGKEVKKDGDKKGCGVEGVKPTMETHGPPPPTATGAPSYAYLHHSYLGSPPYRPPGVPGFIDPNASMFPRIAPSMMWHGSPFAAYTPPGMPRFHEPGAAGPDAQDLSGKSIKGLDLLRHNVSIYPSGPPVTMAAAVAAHKIHELQDAANKGAGATGTAGKPPSSESGGGEMSLAMPQPSSPAIGIAEGSVTSSVSASSSASRSPPAQHHVHTHHHTHVGLGFPLPVAPQFTGPYPGAAVLGTPQPAVFPPAAYGASPNQ
ncbi:unnamed protein product [Notodromas monacha]|uniref:C2H2-type domain-containing protein n=1 Tax=Notodromas monacha TaxID=399045 RepID=A0A7R9G7S7_9CRUS|nr:unnamed protein product [Notodromas monacha]CAG0912545.1 unnamed protein product [Notodromas monacha]